MTKESQIDLAVGIVLKKKVGDYVEKDDVLAVFYANDDTKLQDSINKFETAYKFTASKVDKPKLIRYVVTADGIQQF